MTFKPIEPRGEQLHLPPEFVLVAAQHSALDIDHAAKPADQIDQAVELVGGVAEPGPSHREFATQCSHAALETAQTRREEIARRRTVGLITHGRGLAPGPLPAHAPLAPLSA